MAGDAGLDGSVESVMVVRYVGPGEQEVFLFQCHRLHAVRRISIFPGRGYGVCAGGGAVTGGPVGD